MLSNNLNFTPDQVTIAQSVANIGAIIGGTVVGHFSQMFGRRLSIITVCLVAAALIYPYCFTKDTRITAVAFFEQFCVQGAWGVIPIHLMELSPDAFRTFVVGTSYQLGNLISSPASTIQAEIGERFPLPPRGKIKRYEYSKAMCIFMACVFSYVLVLTLAGPEYLGRSFEIESDDEWSDEEFDAPGADEVQRDPEREAGARREGENGAGYEVRSFEPPR